MKRLLLLLCCVAVALRGAAQVHHAEYYFDTDPGFGQGSQLPYNAPVVDTTFTFTAGIGSLNNGLHRLYVRAYDSSKRAWSHGTPKLFYKEAVLANPLVNIVAAEYFFDTDPGVGAAAGVSVTTAQDVIFSFSGSITAVSNGLHRLFVRVQDANGKWSLRTPQLFYKEAVLSNPLANITAAEYFFDTDPGFGSGNAVTITPGADLACPVTASIASLTNGLHRLFVRTKDANGKWSHSTAQLFYKEAVLSNPLVNISKAEYFFDTDPGVGAATDVPVTAGQDIAFNFNGSIAALCNGLHRIYLRTRDANGKWCLSAPQLFYKEAVLSNPLVSITKAEYYFDTDPGVGSGTNIPITAGQDINIAFNGAINALSNGLHRLVVRSRDANGKWSMGAPALFYKDAIVTHTPGNLVELEWFWDTDPGFGNATPITLPAGNTEVQNFNFNVPVPGSFSNQMHNFYVRAQDDWGLSTVTMVDFTGIPLPVTLLDFGARRDGGRVRIDWQTAVEQNMDKYVVEHSTDARNFTAIGDRNATGNNGGNNAYNLYDEQPAQGVNYYRLRQVELSGTIKYSPVASVLFSDGADDVRVYPNPASGHFSISSHTAISQIILTDMGGKTVQKYDAGSDYSLQNIPAGAYFVRVVMESGGVVTKTIVVR